MPRARRDPQRRRSAFGPAAWLAVSGPVLLVLGIGNVWRSRTGFVIGLVYILAGIALTYRATVWNRRQLRSSGQPLPRLGMQLVLMALPIALGSTVYIALLALFDRS